MTLSDTNRSRTGAPAQFSRRPVAAAIQTSLLSLSLACATAQAADILVTSSRDDDGAGCTLREAINSANTISDLQNGCAVGSENEVDRILFDAAAFSAARRIELAQGELMLTGKSIVIDGGTPESSMAVDAVGLSRVMRIAGGDVSLNNMVLTGGRLPEGDSQTYGGGLFVDNGSTVSLTNSVVTNNTATRRGGGIHVNNNAVLTLESSRVTNNRTEQRSTARAGGINIGDRNLIEINNSLISENTVYSRGGSGSIVAGLLAGDNNTITITNSDISDNKGGALEVRTANQLDLIDSRIARNQLGLPDGGRDGVAGVEVNYQSTANIIRTSISNNLGAFSGGGLVIDRATATITDSLISNNRAIQGPGSGFKIEQSTVDIINTTVSGNTIIGSRGYAAGGVIFNSTVSLQHMTLTDNVLDTDERGFIPGLMIGTSSVSLSNSILANSINVGKPDEIESCYVFPASNYSAGSVITIDSATIVEGGGCGAQRTEDPSLLPLANNGGNTLTHALAADSVAIDTGDLANCKATDQRGAVRDAQCDVGAFEFGVSAASISLSFNVDELNENDGAGIGTITRTGPLDDVLTVTLQSSDVASATVPSSVQLPAGLATANFAINAVDDLIADGNKVVTVTASAVNLVNSVADVTVIDNETAALNLSLARAEAAENSGVVVATIRRNTPTDVDLTVALVSDDENSATVPTSVTIPAGEASFDVDVTLLDNQIADGDRVINIAATSNGLLESNANLTVTDDETPSLSMSVSANTVAENGSPLIGTVSRNTPTTDALTVSLTSSDARLGVPANAIIAAGDNSVTFDLTPVDDQIANGNRIVTVSANATGLRNGQTEVTVTDDDVAALSLSLSADSVEEGDSIIATLSRNTPTQDSVTVALNSSDPSRLTVPAEVIIAAGQSATQVSLNALDNGLVDGNADLSITASVLGSLDGTASLTVTDNDVPTLALSVPNTDIAEASGTVIATLTRNTPNNTAPLTVTLLSSEPNSVAVPATVEFADGELSTTVELNITDDAIANGDLAANLSASVDGFVSANLDVTLIDNEQASLTLNFAQTTLDEASVLRGTVSRNTPSDTALLVTLSSSDADVVSVAASIEIPVGAVSADVIVSAVDNTQIDPERVVTISASTANSTVGGNGVDFTVLDNDDDDRDNVANNVDNCPSNANTNQANLDRDQFGDACDTDIDGDGMPNQFEQANGLNPRNAADANTDNDGDGFTNLQEFEFGTDPNVSDLDENNNGIPDVAEARSINIAPILLLLLDDE